MKPLDMLMIITLILILSHQFKYYKAVQIRVSFSTFDTVITLAMLAIIIAMTVTLAKNVAHIIVGMLGFVYFVLYMCKRGICDEGIIISTRGKELYTFSEIGSVHIDSLNNTLSVSYYTKSHSLITTQLYNSKYKDKIYEIFNNHSIVIS